MRLARAGRVCRAGAWQVPSPLRRYRYRLGFEVDPAGRGRLLVVGLNPSTASLTRRDPTVDTCCAGIARAHGFRELEMTNLFGLRSTDKSALLRVADPVGRNHDVHLIAAVRAADCILLAWGALFAPIVAERAACVEQLVRRHARGPLCVLARNADGSPAHPLYRRLDSPLLPA